MKMNHSYEKALQSIHYGHSCAMRLKMRLDDPTADDDGSVSINDLAQSVVDCFSNAILNLSDKSNSKSGDDQFSDLSSRGSSPSHSQMSLSKKRKISSTSSSENWRVIDSPDRIYYDGFFWRKYGQKYIKKSNNQRSYYRCSYNKDYDCGARKHEQKIKDNPPVYRTTYFGHHTCKINQNQDEIFTTFEDPVEDLRSAQMIRFGKDFDQEKENQKGCFYLSVKQKEDFINQRTGYVDQDVIEENLSSPARSYPLLSSYGSESSAYNSELLLDNLGPWDIFDQLDFGLF